MKTKMLSIFFVLNIFLASIFVSMTIPAFQMEVSAQTKLPSYMSSGGNVKNRMVKKGKTATELLALFAVMVGTGAMIVGGIKMGWGNSQGGKTLLIGGASCLVIVAMAYGATALIVK